MSLGKFTKAMISAKTPVLTGVLLTRPLLSSSNGVDVTYYANVKLNSPHVNFIPVDGSTQEGTAEVLNELKNVPIASDDRLLIYADVGQPVTLARLAGGRIEIIGLSKNQPGFFREVLLVDLCSDTIVSITDATTNSNPIPYGYQESTGGYGTSAYGLTGIYLGGTLQGVRP